jgi:hypothetical protein
MAWRAPRFFRISGRPCGVLWWSARHLRRIVDMNPRIEELVLLTLLACTCLVFAWAYDDMMFSAVFAAEAGFAVVEAAYLSL